jgi:hypothetical protein
MSIALLPSTDKVEDAFDAWDAAAGHTRLARHLWLTSSNDQRGDAAKR